MKPFMHIDLDHNKLTRRCAPVQGMMGRPGEVTPERLSYKGIDFHTEVEFTDDLDTRFYQEQRFWFLLQGFLKDCGVNSSLEGFE